MANVIVDDTYLSDIADAIRAKTGGSDTFTPAQMATAIGNISTSGTSDTISEPLLRTAVLTNQGTSSRLQLAWNGDIRNIMFYMHYGKQASSSSASSNRLQGVIYTPACLGELESSGRTDGKVYLRSWYAAIGTGYSTTYFTGNPPTSNSPYAKYMDLAKSFGDTTNKMYYATIYGYSGDFYPVGYLQLKFPADKVTQDY